MPECQPFCALYYNFKKVDQAKVFAPQYDIVSKEEIFFYKNLSPYNAFHLELAETPELAEHLLEEWKREEILLKDSTPAIYYYELYFTFSERRLKRRGFILLVKLHPYEDGKILPHERTFSFIKEERFSLLKTSQCYFSQIFGLYEDEELRTLNLPVEKELLFDVEFNKERHVVYRVKDRGFIHSIREYLQDKPIYIADGHHRYQTALAYKDHMEKTFEHKEDCDFHYAPFYLTPFEEEGLFMLPTHRHYLFSLEKTMLDSLRKYADELMEFDLTKLEDVLEHYNGKSDVFFLVNQGKGKVFRIKRKVMFEFEKIEPILSRLPLFNFLKLFERVFEQKEEELKAQGMVEFFSNSLEKLGSKGANQGFFVLLPRVLPTVLKDVVSKGKLMPHKSTYFYPKILTGVLFYEAKGKPIPKEFDLCP